MQDLSVGIIEYGAGNVGSVLSAFRYLGVETHIVNEPDDLCRFDKLVLPGVGSFAAAIENLNKRGMSEEIRFQVVNKSKPLLGICLGFQMLFESSTEGGIVNGLGLLKGRIDQLSLGTNTSFKLPHIGFNQVHISSNHSFFRNTQQGSDFYFVHSYCLHSEECTLESFSTTDYGVEFVSAVADRHIMGTQFHPEKSQSNGLVLLQDFIDYQDA